MKDTAFKIIRGGRVLDIDARSAHAVDILVQGDTIHEVGRPGLQAPADTIAIDGNGKLLMPGLVNAHTHGHGSLGKGLGDKWSLELLLNASPWVGGSFTLDDKYLAARLNAAEMVLKGCTAAYDMYFEFPRPSREGLEAAGRGYSDIGVRAVLAPMMADHTLYEAIPGLLEAIPQRLRTHVEKLRLAPASESIAACRELLHSWSFDRNSVRAALGPTIPLHCSDKFLVDCRDLAHEHGIGIQMHLGESKVQAVTGIKRYGKTLARHLDDLGLIGPTFTGAHCVWLDDDDLQLLADKGANVAHNPGSNLRLGSGVAPARQMLDKKITVGVGTDGSASSDNQNMFEAMRLAAFVSRLTTPDYSHWLGTWEVLALATTGGAHALGMENSVGKIAPGYKADILFLELSNVNFVPLNNLANQIVNCEDSSAVDSVMIGGRMVLEQRRFVALDYDKLRRDAQTASDRLRAANAASKERMDAVEQFVGQYCMGLARQPYHVHGHLGDCHE
jgi:guanine deaminase